MEKTKQRESKKKGKKGPLGLQDNDSRSERGLTWQRKEEGGGKKGGTNEQKGGSTNFEGGSSESSSYAKGFHQNGKPAKGGPTRNGKKRKQMEKLLAFTQNGRREHTNLRKRAPTIRGKENKTRKKYWKKKNGQRVTRYEKGGGLQPRAKGAGEGQTKG